MHHIPSQTQLEGFADLWTAECRGLKLPKHRTKHKQNKLKYRSTSPNMPWNNSPREKNPRGEPGIGPKTSWSVGNDATTEPWDRLRNLQNEISLLNIYKLFYIFYQNYLQYKINEIGSKSNWRRKGSELRVIKLRSRNVGRLRNSNSALLITTLILIFKSFMTFSIPVSIFFLNKHWINMWDVEVWRVKLPFLRLVKTEGL